jgi:hypothetical protein
VAGAFLISSLQKVNHMNNKCLLFTALVVLVVSLVICGCGPKAPSSVPLITPAPTPSPEPEPTLKPEPAPSPTPDTTGIELQVHFIDVGQGDAILIDLGEIEVLIDGGDKSPGVVTYLSNYIDGANVF